MSGLEVRNAKITSTQLGIEDHGVLTFWIHLEWDGGAQGFGGYGCDDSPFLSESIRKILETLGVYNWDDLKGKYVRMEGTITKVHRIGHITKNQWYDIEEHSKRFRK